MEANGRHGGEIEEKNRFPTPTTTMIQLTNACKNSTLMRVVLESLAPVLWAWTIKDALWFSVETRETFYSFRSTVSNSGKEKRKKSFLGHTSTMFENHTKFLIWARLHLLLVKWEFWGVFKHCGPKEGGSQKWWERESNAHFGKLFSVPMVEVKASQSALWSERPKKSLIVLFWWINKSFQGQRLRGLHPDFSTLFLNELKTYQSWRYRRSGVNLFASHSPNLWWTRKVRNEIILLHKTLVQHPPSILIEYVGKLCCIR